MRPVILDAVGLDAALEWEASEFTKISGIPCHSEILINEADVHRDSLTALYRIVQEALTNAARHAQATWVGILLERKGKHLVLRVRDNGRGIEEHQVKQPQSLGLLGMRERALSFGGEFKITGTAGRGTEVEVRVPLAAVRAAKDKPAPGRGKRSGDRAT